MTKVFKLGDNVSTDAIIPGRYFYLRSNLNELAKHLCEDIYQDLYSKIDKGDVIVAGKNFGLGSSREHAAQIIKLTGISCILSKSFSRIFYRNAVNIGLLAIECDTDNIDDNDDIVINLEQNTILNITKNTSLKIMPISAVMSKFIKDGGLINHIKKYGDLIIDE